MKFYSFFKDKAGHIYFTNSIVIYPIVMLRHIVISTFNSLERGVGGWGDGRHKEVGCTRISSWLTHLNVFQRKRRAHIYIRFFFPTLRSHSKILT